MTLLRTLRDRVFPDHWSLLLGEIALWSFVVLLVTGTFLTFFFDPSMEQVTYHGSYAPLRGVEMSRAYASVLDISFELRGGLLIRQMHHWAALLFIASIALHLLRVFITGAFRAPRRLNWVVGVALFWLALLQGYTGYMKVDDALSGTGLRVAHALMLSIPVVGSWVASSVFDGEFPGTVIIGRLYLLHLVVPLAMGGLIASHLVLALRQRPAQWVGLGRTSRHLVGHRYFPRHALRQGGLFLLVSGVIAGMGGLFQVNPVWLYGPYQPAVVGSASQPAWYLLFLEGSLRLFPAWETRFTLSGADYTIPPHFWAGVVFPGLLVLLMAGYPVLEARLRRDRGVHHLLQRPRDVPVRTGLAAAAIAFLLILTLAGVSDVIASTFRLSVDALTWAGRIGVVIAPPAAYWVTHRIALGLQQHDRQVLAHGVETGLILRRPDGGYQEIHQPLGPAGLPYRGAPVPKKPNQLGLPGPATRGFFTPIERPAAPPDHRRR
jgi:ubiquinol-cytochrome c reductase cytochrome b subunit